MDAGVLDNNLKTWRCFANDGTWNAAYAPNAIDQTIFYDSEKNKLYMVYGSWSGGLFVLELDKTTGKPIYPGKDGKDEISQNYVDRYFGIHIAGEIICQEKEDILDMIKQVDIIFFMKHMVG